MSNRIIVLLYWNKNSWYSLGPLAASLQKDQLVYEIIKGNPVDQIQDKIEKGFSVIYGESSRSMTLSGLKKRLNEINREIPSKKVFTVVGGPNASGNPREILEMGANFIVIGEGEVTLPELAKKIIYKGNKDIDFSKLPGIAFLDEKGELIRGPSRARIDLDSYCPYSDNEIFPLHPPIELMRGCAFRCRFCQVGYMYGNPRFRSVNKILKIVKHYIKFFKPVKKQVDIRFIAPNSLGYMERERGKVNHTAIFELVQQLKVLDIRTFFGTFPSEVRPEYITDEILALWDDLANQQVSVGFQSGSDRILKDMRREHSVEDGLRAYDLLISHRLTPLFDFLLGTPSETVEDQWKTLELIRELGNRARIRMHYFMPLPGTPWVNSIPAPLGKEIQAEIGRLARAEIVTGEFAKQVEFSLEEN
ncbi:MAG: TIGR04013 family B12-binding domain/radical SAM domain-containing protein [Candidatus Hodarchaeota archaeon]